MQDLTEEQKRDVEHLVHSIKEVQEIKKSARENKGLQAPHQPQIKKKSTALSHNPSKKKMSENHNGISSLKSNKFSQIEAFPKFNDSPHSKNHIIETLTEYFKELVKPRRRIRRMTTKVTE